MSKKSLSSQKESATKSSKDFDDFGQSFKLGSDFSLVVIMLALILFSISAWIGFNQLSKVLDRKAVTPSIPIKHPTSGIYPVEPEAVPESVPVRVPVTESVPMPMPMPMPMPVPVSESVPEAVAAP